MGYRKPGYTTIPEGRFVPSEADSLVTPLQKELESELGKAIDSIGPKNTYLDTLILPDLMRMKSDRLNPGTPEHKRAVYLTNLVLNHAGYMQERIERVTYVDSPMLNIEEVVGNMLTHRIPWLSKEQLGGEKANLTALKTMLPIIFREMQACARLRKEYYTFLRLKAGDIGYKLLHGQPIDQPEKTFFLLYGNTERGTPGEALGLSEKNNPSKLVPIPAQQNSNPLAIEAFELYKKSVEPGPGLNYYRLISNRNWESLVYYYGPYARTLPLTTGYMQPFGDFLQLRLTRQDEKSWTDKDQLTGIRDRFSDLPTSTKAAITQLIPSAPVKAEPFRDLPAGEIEWVMNAPIRVCGPPNCKTPAFLDLPEVRLRCSDETDISIFNWEYTSAMRQRIISNLAGGSSDMMYTDIAMSVESHGAAIVDRLNIDEFSLVDLDQSVIARKLMNANAEIVEEIHFLKSGNTLSSLPVNVTDLTSRGGVVGFRPAFAEFFYPPRNWYFIEDPRALEFITARLGLTRDQAIRNALPITISHNAAVLKRLTGSNPPFDIKELIRIILQARLPEERPTVTPPIAPAQ
jgi:hypothetical protein